MKIARLVQVPTLVLILSLTGGLAANAQTNAQTSDAKLRLLEDKIKAVDQKNELAKANLVKNAADAVTGMTKDPKAKLDALQVRELVQLLRVSDGIDMGHLVVDQNVFLFQRNNTEIRREIKKLPPREAKELNDTLDIVLSGDEGTDIPGAPAKSKK